MHSFITEKHSYCRNFLKGTEASKTYALQKKYKFTWRFQGKISLKQIRSGFSCTHHKELVPQVSGLPTIVA